MAACGTKPQRSRIRPAKGLAWTHGLRFFKPSRRRPLAVISSQLNWIPRCWPVAPVTGDEIAEHEAELTNAYPESATLDGLMDGHIDGEERKLLQSIVDFGDTLVREVMTPRPDIVGIRDTATIADLRALFREQEYSRFPVFKESLDNIAGFVFVKDLVALLGRVHVSQ